MTRSQLEPNLADHSNRKTHLGLGAEVRRGRGVAAEAQPLGQRRGIRNANQGSCAAISETVEDQTQKIEKMAKQYHDLEQVFLSKQEDLQA